MTFNAFLLCFFSTSTFFVARVVADDAIIGGDLAAGVDQFKYQVSLQAYKQHFCGGAIIDDTLVLTAAHCIVDARNEIYDSPIYVVAGTNNYVKYKPPAVAIPVKKIYVPGEFDKRNPVNTSADIAVLRLSRNLGLMIPPQRYLHRIALPSNKHESYAGHNARISGFGYNYMKIINGEEKGGRFDNHLRFADVTIVSNEECQRLYYPYRKIHDGQVCAKAHQHSHSVWSGVCDGDSGGPLVLHGIVIGILSASPAFCSEEFVPGVYTRVVHYLPFIQRAIKDDRDADDFKTRTLIP